MSGRDRVGAPAVVTGQSGPVVVVRTATDGCDAPVVRRAAADHARPREVDRLATREVAASVAPPVRGGQRARVEQVGRPAPTVEGPVVGAGFEEHDLRVGLGGQPPGDDTSCGAGPHDRDVAVGSASQGARPGTRQPVVVPAPGGLSSSNVPSRASMRSLRPPSPVASSHSKLGAADTVVAHLDGEPRPLVHDAQPHRRACACFMAFVTASAQT